MIADVNENNVTDSAKESAIDSANDNSVVRKPKELLRKPNWLKVKAPGGDNYTSIKAMLRKLNLSTVCEEARCPNVAECWGGGTATFMLMGDTCTRGCRFCSVKTSKAPMPVDKDEPEKVGYAIAKMDLDYIVLTSVDRDDMEDYGSSHFAKTIEVIKENNKKIIIEVLTPDFDGVPEYIDKLIKAKPEVIAQNIETVERLTRRVRDRRAGYKKTLDFLEHVKKTDPTRFTKTSIMLGLGEADEEVLQTLKDLRAIGCDVVTFGQYLQPSKKQIPVVEYVTPEKFAQWQALAEEMGFLYVASGPLVRSSYKAGEYFMKGIIDKKKNETVLKS